MTYKTLAKQSQYLRQQAEELNSILKTITPAQWMVLGVIHEGPTRVSAIAKILDITMAFSTNMVSVLERKGLVTRTDETGDNRAKAVTFCGDEEWFVETERRIGEALNKEIK